MLPHSGEFSGNGVYFEKNFFFLKNCENLYEGVFKGAEFGETDYFYQKFDWNQVFDLSNINIATIWSKYLLN